MRIPSSLWKDFFQGSLGKHQQQSSHYRNQQREWRDEQGKFEVSQPICLVFWKTFRFTYRYVPVVICRQRYLFIAPATRVLNAGTDTTFLNKKDRSFYLVLRIRIRDPVSFWPRDPGWVKNHNPDHISESLESIFWVKMLKFVSRIRDGKNSDQGSGSTTLLIFMVNWDKEIIRNNSGSLLTLLYA